MAKASSKARVDLFGGRLPKVVKPPPDSSRVAPVSPAVPRRDAAHYRRYELPEGHGLGPENEPRPGWVDPERDWLAGFLK